MGVARAVRRPDRHCHRGRGGGQAPRGLAHLTLRGAVPHYLGATPPIRPVRRALLTTLASLLDLALDMAPFEAAVWAFRRQCDQAVAHDASVQAYVRELERRTTRRRLRRCAHGVTTTGTRSSSCATSKTSCARNGTGVRSDLPASDPWWRPGGRRDPAEGRTCQVSPHARRQCGNHRAMSRQGSGAHHDFCLLKSSHGMLQRWCPSIAWMQRRRSDVDRSRSEPGVHVRLPWSTEPIIPPAMAGVPGCHCVGRSRA